MREQIAAARHFPAESVPERLGIDGEQDEIMLAGKVLGQRARDLIAAREMNETVANVIGRAIEPAGVLRPFK